MTTPSEVQRQGRLTEMRETEKQLRQVLNGTYVTEAERERRTRQHNEAFLQQHRARMPKTARAVLEADLKRGDSQPGEPHEPIEANGATAVNRIVRIEVRG